VLPIYSRVQYSALFKELEYFKMKEKYSFKMLGTTHPAMQCHIPEDWTFQLHYCGNIRTHTLVLLIRLLMYEELLYKDTKFLEGSLDEF